MKINNFKDTEDLVKKSLDFGYRYKDTSSMVVCKLKLGHSNHVFW